MGDLRTCGRCGAKVWATTLSFFDRAELCYLCRLAEEAHPFYAEARRVYEAQMERGNLSFKGLGWPQEVKVGGTVNRA